MTIVRTRSIKTWALVALSLLFAGVGVTAVGVGPAAAADVCPDGTGGWVKTEDGVGGQSMTVNAPAGKLIVEVCYKAGDNTAYFDAPTGGVDTITITSNLFNNGGQIADLSHYSLRLIDELGLVTAVAPNVVPQCGPNNDTVTPATTEGVTYNVGNWVDNKLIITATANEGYELTEPYKQTITDDDVACEEELTEVTAVAPNVVPQCGPNNDTVTPATTEGVTYNVGNWVDNKLIITATANEGYELTEPYKQTITDEATICPIEIVDISVETAPSAVPDCGPNNDTVTTTATEGVTYNVGNWVDNKLTITASADEGYALLGDKSWTFTDTPVAGCPDEGPVFSFTPQDELAYTGPSSSTGGIATLALLLMSIGTVLVARKARI